MRHHVFQMVAAGIVLATGAAHASPRSRMGEVDYRPDGSVRVGSQVFSTREAFHRSTLFRDSGARCGTPEHTPVMEAISQSDCTLNATHINQDYNDSRTLVIPVVFHVIKKTDGTTGNISAALIQSQVDILNEDFNAMPSTNGSMGTNVKLQFVLAKLDPAGNPTTGIDYVTNNTYFNDPGSGTNAMKRALKWDPTRFLNIYTNDAGGGGTLGYATFPQEEAGGQEDGVVLNWVYVGRNAPGGAPYNLGRTATHEVGHYLGLFHTFQGGCGTSTAPYTTGDLISDTAREAQPNYGCAAVSSGCGGNSPIEDYMDYSEDACMTKFTVEQANRIRCSIINYRWVNTPPAAGFTVTTSGHDATFTNTSMDAQTAAAMLKYKWTFGDGATSTDQNPVHTYATDGTYNVTLEVLDPGSGTNSKTQSVMIMGAATTPDAGVGSGSDQPDGGNGGGGGGGGNDQPGGMAGGCCDAPGSGTSALLCGIPVVLVVARRRRTRR